MSDRMTIPPLPDAWPYEPRGESGELRDVAPGLLGPGWIVRAKEDLVLAGQARPLPEAFGRGGILRVGSVVVRPYRRGGLIRHVNARIYASPVRFQEEFAVHQALWAVGFPTVEPLGYGFRRRLWGVEGVFLTRLADARPWPSCWGESARVLPQLRTLLGALAAWGLHAPDLNATNVLMDPDGQILALDWDRAHWVSGEDLKERYRRRLLRSLQKLHAPDEVLASFTS